MKKHTASLMTAAMLLTVAWLTGCDSKELEQPAGTGTAPALETVAEPVTEAATEAIEATEAAGQSFDDYAAFAAAMAEQHPEKTRNQALLHCLKILQIIFLVLGNIV